MNLLKKGTIDIREYLSEIRANRTARSSMGTNGQNRWQGSQWNDMMSQGSAGANRLSSSPNNSQRNSPNNSQSNSNSQTNSRSPFISSPSVSPPPLPSQINFISQPRFNGAEPQRQFWAQSQGQPWRQQPQSWLPQQHQQASYRPSQPSQILMSSQGFQLSPYPQQFLGSQAYPNYPSPSSQYPQDKWLPQSKQQWPLCISQGAYNSPYGPQLNSIGQKDQNCQLPFTSGYLPVASHQMANPNLPVQYPYPILQPPQPQHLASGTPTINLTTSPASLQKVTLPSREDSKVMLDSIKTSQCITVQQLPGKQETSIQSETLQIKQSQFESQHPKSKNKQIKQLKKIPKKVDLSPQPIQPGDKNKPLEASIQEYKAIDDSKNPQVIEKELKKQSNQIESIDASDGNLKTNNDTNQPTTKSTDQLVTPNQNTKKKRKWSRKPVLIDTQKQDVVIEQRMINQDQCSNKRIQTNGVQTKKIKLKSSQGNVLPKQLSIIIEQRPQQLVQISHPAKGEQKRQEKQEVEDYAAKGYQVQSQQRQPESTIPSFLVSHLDIDVNEGKTQETIQKEKQQQDTKQQFEQSIEELENYIAMAQKSIQSQLNNMTLNVYSSFLNCLPDQDQYTLRLNLIDQCLLDRLKGIV